MKRDRLKIRIRILSAVIILVSLLFIFRLYQVQIAQADHYQEKAESQYVHTKSDLYTRGSIYFTTKEGLNLSAAAIQTGFVLAANPRHLTTTAEDFCQKLEPYLSSTLEKCIERMSLPDRTYVELGDRVSEEEATAIKELDIEAARLYRNQWRYYPGDAVAARTIGFVGYGDTGSELRGKYGLERYYDDLLFQDKQTLSVNFFAELFSNLGELVYKKKDNQEGDVVTSLEPSVSRMLDSELKEVQEEHGSKLTGAIIMDPNTGDIVAMNAIPNFNLNDKSDAEINQFRNPLVDNVYEFGSTIKALTMAAGLDAGVVTPQTTYYDEGSIELDDFTISNYDGVGRGTVPMQEVLNQSLNTGVSFVVKEMGKENFRDYFLNYKLGSESGIDLPNEAHGLVENLHSPREVEYATASFGQGIAMTPIATVRALATLANGGTLVTPHLAQRIEYNNGDTKEILYPKGDRVLKEETSEEISRMLVNVVDDALMGGDVSLPNHTVGAKTGTAQIPDPVNGGYYEDKFLHSFFGYFPAFDPRFIVFLYTVEPEGERYASETLTEPFMDITQFLINYYSIPPDR